MQPAAKHTAVKNIAIIGNPNCGKTTIFNELTGLRQKVGNYPGVTVERKEGKISYDDREISILDLPGTYSLSSNSPDEKIATDILLGKLADVKRPDGVICVVDASNLERNLYLVSQIIDQHYPVIVVLNMIDVAEHNGISINTEKLSSLLGVRVIPTIGSKRVGINELKAAIRNSFAESPATRQWKLPAKVLKEHEELAGLLQQHHHFSSELAFHEATNLLSTPKDIETFQREIARPVLDHVKKDYEKLEFLGFDRFSVFVESRFAWTRQISAAVVSTGKKKINYTDIIDSVVTHRFWGYIIFFSIMLLIFQSIFTWATIPMNLIGTGFEMLERQTGNFIPPGDLHDLIIHGAISGVGAVVVFLPQILLLFLFLGLLEDTGYMARAAFIMDRVMSKVGLHGKSFIPMLSSFACAIPGIMATRTIENQRDRLVTMLVAPLMSCSARLPVYSLLIAGFIPSTLMFGFWNLQGIVMVSMYVIGLISALSMAFLFKKTLLKGKTPDFIMELPPYRLPSLKNIVIQMWERSLLFLKRAGTIILAVSIALWFLATYPKLEKGTSSEKLAHSFVGQAGHLIEPVIQPLGFDWKIGIGILSSVLQREVFVSTMSTIYSVENADENSGSFREKVQQDIDPTTGLPRFTALTAICIMVYYVLAMQCLSTIAVMKRETNGWKWPAFQFAYMTVLAYAGTFVVYRIGLHFM
ncbi:MAG: ferrous iron transport protein B [Bacteroidota bacterium]